MLDFDLRTVDSAYRFVLDSLGMTGEEFVLDFTCKCNSDFEKFWDENFDKIEALDFHYIRIMAFHVTGSLDECQSIKKNGLKNIQMLLKERTILSEFFRKYQLTFDIDRRTMQYRDKVYDINYEKYRHKYFLTGPEAALKSIAYRLYHDFCVNGFLVNDNIYSYGTDIHKRPEFMIDLVRLFPELQVMEDEWIRAMKSYRIDFYAYPEQIHRFNFELDDNDDPPYDNWQELSDFQKMKKWMFAHAIGRIGDGLRETYLYIKDDIFIPPEQIVSYVTI